ncbi:M23 family metallopeptidase [Kitasatospora sp. NPDC088346]|uniref:M23 family metallopeptidase n=1 Tax=Kitasatospora sp. NPDC088346 TaxID=3364073 RepID=UPI00381092A0
MASTHPLHGSAAGTQLLDHPVGQLHQADQGDQGGDPARHRMPRQARSSAPLLGVTAMTAALGATGFAAASSAQAAPAPAPAPVVAADPAEQDGAATADPGLALAARIQQQADGRSAAEEAARLAAAQEAEARHAAQQAQIQAQASAQAQAQAQASAHAQAQAQAQAPQAAPIVLAPPVTGYTLSAHYGQSGSYWSHLHTGLDFAAQTGAPVTAVAAGTVTSAGWSGAYGYRVIQTLPDGTEVWYCHLSRIATADGPVVPGTVLGAVGATGNVTSPHLHLEVRPDGGAPVDPLAWMQARGLNP